MNKKFVKVISLILSCLLLIGAAVGITVSANSEEATPSVEIANKNLAYEGAVQLLFALKVENAEGLIAKVVFTNGDYTVADGVDVDEISKEEGYVKKVAGTTTKNDVEYSLVYSNGIVAKELRKEVVATPVLVDAEGVVKYVGTSATYSPYIYAMNRFDNAQNSASQIELYKAFLDYGAAVQDLLSDNYANLGFADADAAISAWGGWADEYYNVTYVDEVLEYNYSYKRAAEVKAPLVLEANKFAEGKKFLGFFAGETQVFQTGVTSSTWNKYDIKPGSAELNVVATYADVANPYEQFNTATTLPDWAYLNSGDGNTPADPVANGGYGWFEDGIYRIGKKGKDPSYQHFYLNSVATAEAKIDAATYRQSAFDTPAVSASYEFDIKLDSAENIRSDDVVFYFNVYTNTEYRKADEDRPTAFTSYYRNGAWSFEGARIKAGDWANVRFEFVQHPTLPGYLCSVYVNGKLVNDYNMSSSALRAATGYSLPVICIESRYAEYDKINKVYTENTSDIFYSIDNLRAEYETCTEHEWADVEHALYKKSNATCAVGTLYYKSCAKCSFQGTETFELDDKTAHTLAQIPLRDAIKTDATPSTQAEYYQSCSICGNLDTAAETFFYGEFDVFADRTVPSYITASGTNTGVLEDENGNSYLHNSAGSVSAGESKEHKVFVFDGGFDVSCVESVTYEFDFKLNDATCHRSDKSVTFGYLYFYDAAGTRINSYWSMDMNATSSPTSFTLGGKSYNVGDWVHVQVVMEKKYTDDAFVGWTAKMYVNGVAGGAMTVSDALAAYTASVPTFGVYSRGYSYHWDYDFDNPYMYAEHSGEISSDTAADGALAREADCLNAAVYYKSCSSCGIIHERFADGEASGHNFVNVVSDAALKVPATANAFAVYYKSCAGCEELSDETFAGEWLDDFTDGVLSESISDKRMNSTVKYQSETGRNYVNVSGTSENVFVIDGDFDINCVETVTYEFDYRFAGSTSKRTDANETDNRNIGWFYFYNPSNLNTSGASYGRLGYWAMYSNTKENATKNNVFGMDFNTSDWHNVKVVLTKKTDASGAITGWSVALYIDGIKNTTELTKPGDVTGATTFVPVFGIWGRGNVNWSHDFDNVRAYATHTDTVEDYDGDDAFVRDADCYGPAVYNKLCYTCGIIPTPFLYGEKTEHNFVNVVADSAIKTPASATAPAVYYKSCEYCGDVNTELDPFTAGEKDWLAAGQLWPSFHLGETIDKESSYTGNSSATIMSDEGSDELYLRLDRVATSSNTSTYINFNHGPVVEGATKYVYSFDYRFVGAANTTTSKLRMFTSKLIGSGLNATKGASGTNYLLDSATNAGGATTADGVTTYTNHSWHGATINAGQWYKVLVEFTVSSVDETTGVITYNAKFSIDGKAYVNKAVSQKDSTTTNLAPGLSLIMYGTNLNIKDNTIDIKNVNSYVETATSNDAHSGASTQIVSDETFISPATKDAPATYYYSYACCGALDYSKTFTYGYKDYLADGEKYPIVNSNTLAAPTVDETTGEVVDGKYCHIVNDNGNYVWRYEAHNTLPSAVFQISPEENKPVENAVKYIYGFDFRYNSGSTYVKVAENGSESTVNRAFLLRGPSATGVVDKGGDGNHKSFKQWTVNVGDGCLTNFFGLTVQEGEWVNVRIEYVPNYTEGALVSYTCAVYVNGEVAWDGTLTCDTTGDYTNAPTFDIMLSGLCVKDLSFDLDNFAYTCDVAE